MSIQNKLDILRSRYSDEVIEDILAAAVHSVGVVQIARERLRQITSEGYDAAHDDGHPGAMARAGACYAEFAVQTAEVREMQSHDVPANWPWHGRFWKPKNPERDLERAGALSAAEIDSINRRQSLAAE